MSWVVGLPDAYTNLFFDNSEYHFRRRDGTVEWMVIDNNRIGVKRNLDSFDGSDQIQSSLGLNVSLANNTYGLRFYNGPDLNSASADTAVNRASAGLVEISDGGAPEGRCTGNNATCRDLILRAVQTTGYTFANLPSSNDGTLLYCSDCKPTTVVANVITNPVCAGSGGGSIAFRVGGAWNCGQTY